MERLFYEGDNYLCECVPNRELGRTIHDMKRGRNYPADVDVVIVNDEDLPDSKYRLAWKIDGDNVVLNESKVLKIDFVDPETEWADSELESLPSRIEDVEDSGKSADNLRTYRAALKQYKADLYMPNISRPKLKTGILS